MTQSRDEKELAARLRADLEEGGCDPEIVKFLVSLVERCLDAPSKEEVVIVALTMGEATAAHYALTLEHDWATQMGGDSPYATDIVAVMGKLEEALPTLKPAP